ncbi:MAG: M18 family aminopeptidase [Fibrobacter sp.]|nr:M18 family aminopeptidase [Fibrobacter sp.]
MTAQELNSDFLKFLDESHSPYHLVEQCEFALRMREFEELKEADLWNLIPGHSYYVSRNQSSTFAFRIPHGVSDSSSWRLIAAHTDSPTLKIKAIPTNGKLSLNVEPYGSPILESWLDRSLRVAGIVYYQLENEDDILYQTIELPFTVRIPRLAIHLTKDDDSLNPQNHLKAMWTGDSQADFIAEIYALLPDQAKILNFDFELSVQENAVLWGSQQEYIAAAKIDNLAMVHAALHALKHSPNHQEHFTGAVFFHNEEIGSLSQNGAASQFLPSILKRIAANFEYTEDDYFAQIAQSFLISADMAHGVHPNYPERHDEDHRPLLNQGPVLKTNANGRYATTAASAAQWMALCEKAQVKSQVISSRNDMRTGSTVGPTLAALTGINTVDVGNPMLSMHSISECAGIKDHRKIVKIFKSYFT